ncbi:hypothetical protein CSB37_00185 [bacterium DOLZORAL124_38_8]|nr:MAG: hypothetical protein CSB37_00185 [bacterium DOLZORAL124_38_8]
MICFFGGKRYSPFCIMKTMVRWVCVILLSLFLNGFVSAKRLIFSNEYSDMQADGTFVIDVQDYESEIELKFGNNIDAAIVFERVDNEFKINRAVDFNNNEIKNARIEHLSAAPICDTTQKGKLYFNTTDSKSYVCNGTSWNQIDAVGNGSGVLAPFITTTTPVTYDGLSTQTITLDGVNFLPSTTISIPNFAGTINNTNVLSPTRLEVNVTLPNINQTYSFVASNGGAGSTDWGNNNGNNLLVVQSTILEPVANCNDGAQGTVCSALNTTVSGTYCLDTDNNDVTAPELTYCDMETSGGGWTRVVRTTGNNHQFGQKNHNYSYAIPTANQGIYKSYVSVKNFSEVMIKKVGTTDFASYNLVNAVSGDSIYDLMTYCKNQPGKPNNKTAWDGARVKGMTSEYSGTKSAGNLNYPYFFMCGVNESGDTDQAYMSFSDSTGTNNNWGDGWRRTTQKGTLWSLLNGDYYNKASGKHIGNGYSQAGAGYKGNNNGTYEIYIK